MNASPKTADHQLMDYRRLCGDSSVTGRGFPYFQFPDCRRCKWRPAAPPPSPSLSACRLRQRWLSWTSSCCRRSSYGSLSCRPSCRSPGYRRSGAAARGVDMRIGLDALLLFATFCAKRKHEKVRFYALLKQGIVWQVAGTTYKTESLHSMM